MLFPNFNRLENLTNYMLCIIKSTIWMHLGCRDRLHCIWKLPYHWVFDADYLTDFVVSLRRFEGNELTVWMTRMLVAFDVAAAVVVDTIVAAAVQL